MNTSICSGRRAERCSTARPACALAAVAYGADGLCVEAHVEPARGLGDDPKQAVTPAVLAGLIRDARALHAVRRTSRPS